jgi:hypothetical protein
LQHFHGMSQVLLLRSTGIVFNEHCERPVA